MKPGRMESVGAGGECWLELAGSLTDLSYDARTGCVFVCMCLSVCVPVLELGIVRLVSVSLSVNLWIFAGCCHFDLPSSQTYLWIWTNKRIVVLAFM